MVLCASHGWASHFKIFSSISFLFFRHKDLPLSRTWLLADFLGYISTMSAGRKLVDSGSRELEELANE